MSSVTSGSVEVAASVVVEGRHSLVPCRVKMSARCFQGLLQPQIISWLFHIKFTQLFSRPLLLYIEGVSSLLISVK